MRGKRYRLRLYNRSCVRFLKRQSKLANPVLLQQQKPFYARGNRLYKNRARAVAFELGKKVPSFAKYFYAIFFRNGLERKRLRIRFLKRAKRFVLFVLQVVRSHLPTSGAEKNKSFRVKVKGNAAAKNRIIHLRYIRLCLYAVTLYCHAVQSRRTLCLLLLRR